MNIRNHFPTEELQKRDAAHHLHPFTAQHDLANKGSRIITSAQGVMSTIVMVNNFWTQWLDYGVLISVMVEKSWLRLLRGK